MVTKYKKNIKNKEGLTKTTELRVDEKIRHVATRKGDSKILAVTSRELVAAEAHYHQCCYCNYTRSWSEKDIENKNQKNLLAIQRIHLQKLRLTNCFSIILNKN